MSADSGRVPAGLDARGFQFEYLGRETWTKDWGYGAIERTKAVVVRATGFGCEASLRIGKVRGGRWAYGRKRVRYHVARWANVVMEFAGTDDYKKTRRVFSLLKRPDGTQYSDPEDIPEFFDQFEVVPLSRVVDDGKRYKGLAVLVREDDWRGMSQLALQRLVERGQLFPRNALRDHV